MYTDVTYYILTFQALQSSRGAVQTQAQTSYSIATPTSEIRMQPVSAHQVEDQTNTTALPHVPSQKFPVGVPGQPLSNPQTQTNNNANDTSNLPGNNFNQTAPNTNQSVEGTTKSHPTVSQKNSAIARPRASGATPLNLMDASPYQLLPPPPPGSKAKKQLLGKTESNPLQKTSATVNHSTEKLVEIQHADIQTDIHCESPERGVKPYAPCQGTQQKAHLSITHFRHPVLCCLP